MVKSSSKKSPAPKNRVIIVRGQNLRAVIDGLLEARRQAWLDAQSESSWIGVSRKGKASKSEVRDLIRLCTLVRSYDETLLSLGCQARSNSVATLRTQARLSVKKIMDQYGFDD